MSAPASSPAQAARRRIISLDVLRGLAILGTLLTNIWIFSNSASRGVGTEVEEALTGSGALDTFNMVVGKVLELVTDGKYIGLLTIMFGIGLEIQRQSALRRGDAWPGRYPWRAAILILDGLLNYIFIFEFDVLMGYGLTALVVAAVMAKSPRTQKIWMWIGLLVHFGGMLAASLFFWWSNRGLEDIDDAETVTRDLGEFAELGHFDTSSYWGMVMNRLQDFIGGRAEIPIMFVMGLGLFLVGAHLYRAGLFDPANARLRRIVMGVGFGIGVPLDWTLRLTAGEDSGTFAMFTRYGSSSIVAFGILAAVAAFYAHRQKTGVVGHGLSLVGRMALTNYILQNLIASVIFYDWGLGLSAKIPAQWNTLATLGIYVGIAGLLIGLSALWLRRFPRGPVEIVWHDMVDMLADGHERRRDARKARKAAKAAKATKALEPVSS